MKTRNLIALATFSGLLVAAGCTSKSNNAADTAGTAAMTDTGMGMGAGTTGSMGNTGTTGTMTDSTGATTGTTGTMDSAGRPYGDTIKR